MAYKKKEIIEELPNENDEEVSEEVVQAVAQGIVEVAEEDGKTVEEIVDEIIDEANDEVEEPEIDIEKLNKDYNGDLRGFKTLKDAIDYPNTDEFKKLDIGCRTEYTNWLKNILEEE